MLCGAPCCLCIAIIIYIIVTLTILFIMTLCMDAPVIAALCWGCCLMICYFDNRYPEYADENNVDNHDYAVDQSTNYIHVSKSNPVTAMKVKSKEGNINVNSPTSSGSTGNIIKPNLKKRMKDLDVKKQMKHNVLNSFFCACGGSGKASI